MRRMLVWIPIALAIAVLAVLLANRGPGSDEGSELDRGRGEVVEKEPHLEGHAPPKAPEPASKRTGTASISGTVTRDGEPARARVEIWQGRYNFGDQASLTRLPYGAGEPIAATDSAEDGTYRIEGLEVGRYEVTARADDGASAWARGHCFSMDPHSVLPLVLYGGAGVLVGRAVHADGTPFRGFAYAFVGGHPRHGATTPLRPTPTDEAGRFRLGGLPEGEVDLALVKPGITQSVFGNVAVPQTTEHVFVVEDGLASHAGTVVADDTGEAIVGARISYYFYVRAKRPRRRFAHVTETDDAGAFEVLMPEADGTLWVRAEGFATDQVTLNPETVLDLRMKRFGRVIGRVVEKEGGRPVAGARIHGWNWGGWDMKSPLDVSAEDGSFTAAVVPGDGMIYVLDEDWVSVALLGLTKRGHNPSYVEAEQGQTTDVVVEVLPAGAVHGTVRDADGRPMAGVLVGLAHPPRWEGFSQVWSHEDVCTCVTDEEGHYRIGALIPGFPYHVTARPVEGLPAESDLVTATSGEELEIDLRVPAALHLEVQVVEKGSGSPVAGARVYVRQGRHAAHATTGEDGIARVEPMLPKPVTLHVTCEGYISPTGEMWESMGTGLHLPAPTQDADPVVVELTKGVSFEGCILAADGSPWTKGGMLMLHPAGAPARGLGLVGGRPLGKDGVFSGLGPVPPGTYDLVLTDGEITNRKLRARWTVETGWEDLALRVDPAKAEEEERNRVVIQVVDPRGHAVTGWINVYAKSGRQWNWILKPEGYAPEGLEPGATAWVLVHGGRLKSGEKAGGIWAGPLEMKAGANRIQLDSPLKLAGQVTGPDGTPVAGLHLLFEAVPPENAPYVPGTFALPRARTDKAGRFEIEGLAPGAHRILLVPSDEYALLRPVTAMAGRDDVEIRLEMGTAVEIRIVDADEAPVGGAVVTAALDGVPDAEREAITDEEGKARLAGLSPRTAYDLTVEPPDSRSDLAGACRTGWAPASAEIPLHTGRVIQGTVFKGDAPLPGGVVWWKDRRGLWRRAFAARTGTFRITVLSDSEVTLRAGEGGGAFDVRRAGEAVVVPADQTEVELRLP